MQMTKKDALDELSVDLEEEAIKHNLDDSLLVIRLHKEILALTKELWKAEEVISNLYDQINDLK